MMFALKDRYTVQDLVQIMELLRGEDGCPWDREQTHESIRNNFIEETYEVVEAIDNQDPALLREELGDVLLQVAFHAQMEKERGGFDFDDVADEICKKLIVRHPHIFADTVADTSEQVLRNWDAIKRQTKQQQTYAETLESVPRSLPALMRAEKVQHRAGRAGMEYPDTAGAFADLRSELAELTDALQEQDRQAAADELGDVLFACVNVARHLDADAEELLTRSCDRFQQRFAIAEQLARQQGLDMPQASQAELGRLWSEAKRRLQA